MAFDTLPDIPQADYDQAQADRFDEQTRHKISRIGFDAAVNHRIATLSRVLPSDIERGPSDALIQRVPRPPQPALIPPPEPAPPPDYGPMPTTNMPSGP